jgi:hypothetical protein
MVWFAKNSTTTLKVQVPVKYFLPQLKTLKVGQKQFVATANSQ